MALTQREAKAMKEAARNAMNIISNNQPVTRQDCFGNEGPKKFRDLQKRFLSNLAEAGIIVKTESEGPNMPSTYRLKNAKALVRVHDNDLELVNMIWPQAGAAAEIEKLGQLGLLPPVEEPEPAPAPVAQPAAPTPVVAQPPQPEAQPNGPATFVPPAVPEASMEEVGLTVEQLKRITELGVVPLLEWIRDALVAQGKRMDAMEKQIAELHKMWSSQ